MYLSPDCNLNNSAHITVILLNAGSVSYRFCMYTFMKT